MSSSAIIFGSLAAVAACFYIYIKSQKNLVQYETETIEGTVHFKDIVEWLKSLNLQKDIHTPFMAKYDAPELKSINIQHPIPEGYNGIFVGIYCENNNSFKKVKLIIAKEFDEETKSIFGDNSFVVLS